MKEDDDIIYKWEDKGPSFTKMKMNQYVEAGEIELKNKSVDEDPCNTVKEKCNRLVNSMFNRKEISEYIS